MLLLGLSGPANATAVTAEISDSDGHPVANAVVTLISAAGIPPGSPRLANEKTIDQRNETFIPLVTIVPKGGRIIFANNDQTTHQVYSFSAVKRFEITLNRGQTSPPVVFDMPGVAAIGCNIHDHMIAYAYVAESPWTALTGADGRAVIADVPPGRYQTQIWHPQFPPGREAPSTVADIAGETQRLTLSTRLGAATGGRLAHSHAGSY